VNREGRELGAVVALRSDGRDAQWLEVERQVPAVGKSKGSARVLIPLVEQYVDAVDAGAGVIRVDWQEDW
jgi:ribosomal 30S subunit maturation factor RimM